ncbi:MAG: HEAT repeat domain-containing protein [Bdellovibrionota bacterium]
MIDQKSVSSGSLMAKLARDPAVREFALYGIGELGVYEATPLLIRYMRDENCNNRGNAYRALQKLYPKEFNIEFHHDPEYTQEKRCSNVQLVEGQSRSLKNCSLEQKTDQEKQEAEASWEKYGKEYLDRPAN